MAKKKDEEKKSLSRREFLKDTGMVVGGAALTMGALSLAGCASPEAETTTVTAPGTTKTTTVTGPGTTATVTGPGTTVTKTVTGPGTTVTTTTTLAGGVVVPEAARPIPPVSAPATWDYETDVVVVGGGGGSGLVAAVTAAEKGAKVIGLEKNSFCGGDTSCAMVFMGMGSKFQKRLGVTIPPIETVVAGELTRPNATSGHDPTMCRMLVERHGETMDWLEEMGVVFETGPAAGFPPGLGHVPIDPEHPEEGYYRWFPHNAKGFTIALKKRADALGVNILLRTPAVALITEAGRVIGVKAETADGKTLYVKGKVVVLAAGGFFANKDMVKRYVSPRRIAQVRHWGLPSATGDGIRMGQGVGAKVDTMEEIEIWDGPSPYASEGLDLNYYAASQLTRQSSLSVNKLGKRFFDESRMLGQIFGYHGAQKLSQPDQTSFTLFDADCIKKEDIIEKFQPLACEYPIPWFEEEFESQLAEGIIMKADTIEGLAGLMGVDSKTLKETVDKYNEYCDKGYDPEFFKPAMYLHPLRKPPYYAAEQRGGSCYETYGGLVFDDKLRVVDEKGGVIPGLYVAGENARCINDLLNALPSGRIAGENAAAEALGK